MREIFISLLNMSISAGWLVLCVVILRLFLKKAPRWIACMLWAMVAVRLLCPVSIESGLSLVPSANTVPEEIIYSESPEIQTGIPAVNSTVNPIISESLAPSEDAKMTPAELITGIATAVWIGGMAAMAVYATVSYIRIRRRVSEAIEEEKGVWICDRVNTPFILGMISPRIILPSDMAEEDKRYVISHERAHLSRKDHLWKPLGYVLLTVYWFNPLIWIAYILLCRDIEAACDEKVIKKLGEEAKKPYAMALINCSIPKKMINACPLAFGENGVKERVKNVLNYKKPAFWVIIVSVVACIAVGVFFLTNPKGDKAENTPDKDENAVVDADGGEDGTDEKTEETTGAGDKEEMETTTVSPETDDGNVAETIPHTADKDDPSDTTVAAPVTPAEKAPAKAPETSAEKAPAKTPAKTQDTTPAKTPSKTEETTAVKDTVQEPEKENSVAYAIEAPSEELLQRIEDDYYYGYLGKTEDGFKTRIKEYYGEYDGCVPVIFLLPYAAGDFAHDIVKKEEIGGVIFNYKWERIKVWKDGEFYTVREAYEGGHLTKESLVIIAELYNTQTYVDLLSRTNETVRRP